MKHVVSIHYNRLIHRKRIADSLIPARAKNIKGRPVQTRKKI